MTEEGVLISIRPHWTELIINKHKRIEIRKNLPHLAVPFTVYVYCTLNGQEKWLAGIKGKYPPQKLNGYVVAEFTCDSIETLPYDTFNGIRVSEKAPLVLINESAKSFNDLAKARDEVASAVYDKFGYWLEQEPVEIINTKNRGAQL